MNQRIGERGSNLATGIYYGLVSIDGMEKGPFIAVTSVGWNPFYKNEKKAVEVHILESLDDFYDHTIRVTLFGYLRDECSFDGIGKQRGYEKKIKMKNHKTKYWYIMRNKYVVTEQML